MADLAQQTDLAQSISAMSRVASTDPAAPVSRAPRDALYMLLPEVYRSLDAQNGFALRKVMSVMDAMAQAVDANILALYDDWFVETCAAWALPLIAELVGVTDLSADRAPLPRQRERIANTLLYRANAGQTAVIGRAVGASGGWPVCATEGGRRMLVTQSLRFTGLSSASTVDVSDPDTLSQINRPFSTTCRSPSITAQGRHGSGACAIWAPRDQLNCIDVAMFATEATALARIEAVPDGRGHAHLMHPGGLEAPLFRPAIAPATPLSARQAVNVPQPVSASELSTLAATDPHALPLQVWVETGRGKKASAEAVPPSKMLFSRLTPGQRPSGHKVQIDPARGILVLGEGYLSGSPPRVWTSFFRGTMGTLGGGFPQTPPQADLDFDWIAVVGDTPWSRLPTSDQPGAQVPVSLAAAIKEFDSCAMAHQQASCDGRIFQGVIYIADSAAHRLPQRTIALHGQSLTIRAMPGQWPTLSGRALVKNQCDVGHLAFDGVFLNGRLDVSGAVELVAVNSTLGSPLRPGPGLQTAIRATSTQAGACQIYLGNCFSGPVELADDCQLNAADCVFDAGAFSRLAVGPHSGKPGSGPICRLDAVTVLGRVQARQITRMAHLLHTGPVSVAYGDGNLPRGSDYVWWSRQIGQPGYAVPAPTTADGSFDTVRAAPGAFHNMDFPQRLRSAQAELDDFLIIGQSAKIGWAG